MGKVRITEDATEAEGTGSSRGALQEPMFKPLKRLTPIVQAALAGWMLATCAQAQLFGSSPRHNIEQGAEVAELIERQIGLCSSPAAEAYLRGAPTRDRKELARQTFSDLLWLKHCAPADVARGPAAFRTRAGLSEIKTRCPG